MAKVTGFLIFMKQYPAMVPKLCKTCKGEDEMFKRLDEGIENGNLDVINLAMNSIVSIVKTSPLQQAEQLIIAMNDPNVHKIEF